MHPGWRIEDEGCRSNRFSTNQDRWNARGMLIFPCIRCHTYVNRVATARKKSRTVRKYLLKKKPGKVGEFFIPREASEIGSRRRLIVNYTNNLISLKIREIFALILWDLFSFYSPWWTEKINEILGNSNMRKWSLVIHIVTNFKRDLIRFLTKSH